MPPTINAKCNALRLLMREVTSGVEEYTYHFPLSQCTYLQALHARYMTFPQLRTLNLFTSQDLLSWASLPSASTRTLANGFLLCIQAFSSLITERCHPVIQAGQEPVLNIKWFLTHGHVHHFAAGYPLYSAWRLHSLLNLKVQLMLPCNSWPPLGRVVTYEA